MSIVLPVVSVLVTVLVLGALGCCCYRRCQRRSLESLLLKSQSSQLGTEIDGVTVSVKSALEHALQSLDVSETPSKVTSKFVAPPKALMMGRPVDAALGLAFYMRVEDDDMYALMNRGMAAILDEFEREGTGDDSYWLDYVLRQPAAEARMRHGVRDQGRNGERFADFVRHPNSRQANLSEAHVLALRLYTTPCFRSLNDPLRDAERQSAHPFAATIAFLNEGIRRLRSIGAVGEDAQKEQILWRGMANLSITGDFMAMGGTEVAPMSTTPKLDVAVQYGLSSSTLLFRLTTSNFMDRGASLEFLSAFPAEHEVLYPPLTFLRPRGEPYHLKIDEISFTVLSVEPVFGS